MLPGEAGILVSAVIEVERGALVVETREIGEQTLVCELLCEKGVEAVEAHKQYTSRTSHYAILARTGENRNLFGGGDVVFESGGDRNMRFTEAGIFIGGKD